jgi:hypothetical protein
LLSDRLDIQRRATADFCSTSCQQRKFRLSACRSFATNAVRLQLHEAACNLGKFMRALAMPETAEPWSLTNLREKLIEIGAKVVSHSRYVTFQMAEVAAPRNLLGKFFG